MASLGIGVRVFPRCQPKTITASTPQCIDRAALFSRHPGSTVRSGCTGCRCCSRTSHYRLSTSRPSRRLPWLQVELQILFVDAPTHGDTGMQILTGARMAREVSLANLACDRLPSRSGAPQQITFFPQLHAHLQQVEFEAIKNPARWPGFVCRLRHLHAQVRQDGDNFSHFLTDVNSYATS